MSGEGNRSRNKGLKGEREVRAAFHEAGWATRGLESSGDWLAFRVRSIIDGVVTNDELHVEVKRQERLRLPEWLAQAAAESPAGVPPVVAFRQNRGEWYACLPLAALLELTS